VSERGMTTIETRWAPDWTEWAMNCLDDEQLSHCGHLDTNTIYEDCTYCLDLVTHAEHHTMSAPDRWCEFCEDWRRIARTRPWRTTMSVPRSDRAG
jgi:hypothetical protein